MSDQTFPSLDSTLVTKERRLLAQLVSEVNCHNLFDYDYDDDMILI